MILFYSLTCILLLKQHYKYYVMLRDFPFLLQHFYIYLHLFILNIVIKYYEIETLTFTFVATTIFVIRGKILHDYIEGSIVKRSSRFFCSSTIGHHISRYPIEIIRSIVSHRSPLQLSIFSCSRTKSSEEIESGSM